MMCSGEKRGFDFFLSICLSVFNVFKDMYSKNVFIDNNIEFVYFFRQRQKGTLLPGKSVLKTKI